MFRVRGLAIVLAIVLGLSDITSAKMKYKPCGGYRIKPYECEDGELCVDDPYVEGCGMACDRPGICVRPVFVCGGFAGRACRHGMMCIDDPRDECDSEHRGADCGGICV